MIKRFNRFELKYLVTAAQCDALKRDILHHMKPDENGTAAGSYPIVSLYYDSADLACMRAKLEGIKFRRKLRIRRYGIEEQAPVFVEIKQRINRTTQKRRMVLPLAEAYDLCAGRFDHTVANADDAAVADEILFLVRALALQPTCLIGYQRDALVGGPYDPGLRVTFDHSLWTAQASDGLSTSAVRHSLAPPTFMIMEVKANEAVPLWLANILARHQCPLWRYSKYCAGAARLTELEFLPTSQASALHGGSFDEVSDDG
jgi:hypothetical protein